MTRITIDSSDWIYRYPYYREPKTTDDVGIFFKEETGTVDCGWEQWKYRGSRLRYEYKCPYCGYINVRYEQAARLVCEKCGRSFYLWLDLIKRGD